MSKITIRKQRLERSFGVSAQSVSTYLTLGFLPAPMAIESHLVAFNEYSAGFEEKYDAEKNTFRRSLPQFVSHTQSEQLSKDEFDARLESTLLSSVATAVAGYESVFLLASGGKDSTALAWAIKELGVKCTLVHCTNRGREDELPSVEQTARRLDLEVLVVPDQFAPVIEHLSKSASNLELPIGDQAFFAYVAAIKAITGLVSDETRILIIDGMGNDVYMGHVPGKRERTLCKLPRFRNLHEDLISRSYSSDYIHYALETIGRPPYARMFSGVGFAQSDPAIFGDFDKVYKANRGNVVLRRALLRGGIFDIDCCMRKGVLAARTVPNVEVVYPFFDLPLIHLFSQLSDPMCYDAKKSINKIPLRNFLDKRGLSTQYVDCEKGSFRFNLDEIADFYQPSVEFLNLLDQGFIRRKYVSRLLKSAASSFVSAQKVGILLTLEKYLNDNGLYDAPIDFESSMIQMKYF